MAKSSPANTSAKALNSLRKKAAACKACSLYKLGTQTVFGNGATNAQLMLVGEQPGNEEDQTGQPFVGPAGRLLDKALKAARIQRNKVYLTNAVKHFKWTPGERPQKPRLHKTPNASEVKACHPWLESEVALVQPKIILAMGRTAVLACLGRNVPIAANRQKVLTHPQFGWKVMPTWHPSAILRAYDKTSREKLFAQLVEDLQKAKSFEISK